MINDFNNFLNEKSSLEDPVIEEFVDYFNKTIPDKIVKVIEKKWEEYVESINIHYKEITSDIETYKKEDKYLLESIRRILDFFINRTNRKSYTINSVGDYGYDLHIFSHYVDDKIEDKDSLLNYIEHYGKEELSAIIESKILEYNISEINNIIDKYKYTITKNKANDYNL